MKNYKIKVYQKTDFEPWNDFISQAKNATFLFHRNFIDYHKNRFQDYSLIVYLEDKIQAVLPANRVDNTVFSHQGLTYGSLVYSENIKLIQVSEIVKAILIFLHKNKIEKLHLKILPIIYCQKPSDELLYILFLLEATLTRRDSLSVLDLSKKNKISRIRKRGVKKAISNGLTIKEEVCFEAFWSSILIPNLNQKYQVKPVHSLEEIIRLKKYFPKNIRQFNVYHNDEIVAGTTIFETETVAHCQYISKFGDKNLGSLDFLYNFLIQEKFAHKRFFNFGISNENQGKNLNSGLLYWKESFGASTIIQDFYEVETAKSSLLNNILL